jgi:hypothetical protein
MKARIATVVSARSQASSSVDKVYRRARKAAIATEDQAINALCDARLKERRHPLQKLLNQLGHELERWLRQFIRKGPARPARSDPAKSRPGHSRCAIEPLPGQETSGAGKPFLRPGRDYRLVYSVYSHERLIDFEFVGDRKEAYRWIRHV